MQMQTCCFCFRQRTGCLLIGAFNVIFGCLGFLQSVHVACATGKFWGSAPFEMCFSLVYLVTAVFLLRGVMLRELRFIMAWIFFSILRLLGEVLYLIFAHIVPYGTVKEWPAIPYPKKGEYQLWSEFYDSSTYKDYQHQLAIRKVDELNHAAQKVMDLETILAHSLVIVLSGYFVAAVCTYRRLLQLGTEKADARVTSRQAEQTV